MVSQNQWGNITWIFLHTLAEKVDENKFLEIKKNLLAILFGICENLPCPICSQSAISILNKAFLNNIKTKAHYIEFLRQFHNIVNIKLSKPQISISQLNNLYSRNNMNLISHKFLKIYSSKTFNIKLLTQSMQKDIYIKELLKELNIIKNHIKI